MTHLASLREGILRCEYTSWRMWLWFFLCSLLFFNAQCFQRSYMKPTLSRTTSYLKATLPSDPLVAAVLSQGISNAAFIYSNTIVLRYVTTSLKSHVFCLVAPYYLGVLFKTRAALSWFPQLSRQFPLLNMLKFITDPYLMIFRRVVPTIGGVDISIIPAIFILDFLSKSAAALGAETPPQW